jgi:O-antigen ligase
MNHIRAPSGGAGAGEGKGGWRPAAAARSLPTVEGVLPPNGATTAHRDVSRAAVAALAVLVGLAVLAPWPFGGVPLRVSGTIAIVSLGVALVTLPATWRRRAALPQWAARALAGLWILAVLQLLPLPHALHTALAPGSAALWDPASAAAATVLGPGPHPISVYPEATVRWLALSTGIVGLALAVAPALGRRRAALPAVLVLVAGGTAVAVFGLVARLVFGDKIYGVFTVPTVAPFGPFVSKNAFAACVEMTALLAVGLAAGLADEARAGAGWLDWLETPRASRVVFAAAAAVVLVLAVPASLSRGGVVSLGAGLVVFLLTRVAWDPGRRAIRRTAVLAAVCALSVAGLVAVLPMEARDRVRTLGSLDADPSGAYRLSAWRDTLGLVSASPLLGSGFGAYGDAVARLKTSSTAVRLEHAENDYLELLAEGGGATGVLLLILGAATLSASWRGIRAERHRLLRGLRAGALGGVAAALVHSAVDFVLRIPANALLFAALLALLLASPGTSGDSAGRGDGRGRALPAVLLAATLVAALLVPWKERAFDLSLLKRASSDAVEGPRWRLLESDLERHLRHRPADASAWVALAWLRLPAAPREAAALASWGASLDPTHAALRREADRIVAAAQSQPRSP